MRHGFIFAASALLLGSLCQAQTLQPESARFSVHQGSQSVGTANYQIQPEAGGYRVTAHGNLKLEKLAYAFSKTERLDQNLAIVSENLSGTVNGSAVNVAVHTGPDKFILDISANGQSYNNSLDRHPQTIFFPDFDLSSYAVLVRIAGGQPGGPQPWALIPKQTGLLMNAKFETQPSLKGTLDGSSIAIDHHVLTIGSVTSDVYSAPDGRVMEVDIPSQGFAIVRDQFQLQPPANPGAGPPPQQQQTQQ